MFPAAAASFWRTVPSGTLRKRALWIVFHFWVLYFKTEFDPFKKLIHYTRPLPTLKLSLILSKMVWHSLRPLSRRKCWQGQACRCAAGPRCPVCGHRQTPSSVCGHRQTLSFPISNGLCTRVARGLNCHGWQNEPQFCFGTQRQKTQLFTNYVVIIINCVAIITDYLDSNYVKRITRT